MHVAIDGRALGSGQGGDETMLRGFLRGLHAAGDDDQRVTVLLPVDASLPADLVGVDRFTVVPVPRRPGPLHFGYELPRQLRALHPRPDVIGSTPHGPLWGGVSSALMGGDLSPRRDPQWYPRATRLRLEFTIRYQVPRAGAVVTVSEFSRAEILSMCKIESERVCVVPNTIEPPRELRADDEERCAAWLTSAGVQGPFVLYVGNLHPRKNVAGLIRGFVAARRESAALSDTQLVIAGARWWGDAEQREIALAAPGSVVMLGRVDDAQREYLLRNARALAYLSLYEGFGLPPVEAMARGTPVLASNCASIPEVTGGAALLVDPLDVDAVAGGLVQITTDDSLRARLCEQGLVRAAHFSIANSGAAAVDAVRVAATRSR